MPIISNRGYYAGGITLMLAAVALVLRPTVTRVAIAVFGVLSLAVAVGVEPFFAIVTALPGFSTAHNGRLVIFLLLALALLAGWGLDELSRRDRAPARPAADRAGAAAAIFCAPVVWMLAAGTLGPEPAAGARSRSHGASPTRRRSLPGRRSSAPGDADRDDPAERAAAVAAARRARPGADRAAADRRPAAPPRACWAPRPSRVGGRGAGRRPLPGEHGLQVFMLLMNGLAIYLRNKFERRW